MIEELSDIDPGTFNSWRAALRNAAVEVAFYKTSGRFPLGSPGKVNTYAIFADFLRWLRALQFSAERYSTQGPGS